MRVVRVINNDFASLWDQLLSNTDNLSALYGRANLAFYREVCNTNDIEEVSFIISEEDRPICGVKAFRHRPVNREVEISCYGLPLLYLQRRDLNLSAMPRAQRLLKAEIDTQLKAFSGTGILRYRDFLLGGAISPLGRFLLEKGGVATSRFSQIIDLEPTAEDLHQGLTKAYKWAVNWGKKNLSIRVLDLTSITTEEIEKFRLLHLDVAGRATRTRQSWELQHEMVLAGEAFCVLAYMEEVLVCAALFPHSKTHCFYGVSASRRDLFDKPLSHGVIWAALLHAKNLGIRHFEMGEQLFPMAPCPSPTSKELGISFFKRAFGGNTHLFLDIGLTINSVHTDSSHNPHEC